MAAWRRIGVGLFSLGLLAACSGCPFRKERIKIEANGAVTMKLEYGGSPQEVERFDALPSERTGWKTRRVVEIDTDAQGKKKKTVTIHAEQAFPPGVELPRRFTPSDDPSVAWVLDFPTRVWFEDRADGRYVYFHRVYTPRRWAYAHYWEEVLVDEEVRSLSEKPLDELTDDERSKIVESLAAVEAYRQIEFAAEALRAEFPELPLEHGLRARRALLDVYEQEYDHFHHLMTACVEQPKTDRDACLQHETEEALARGYEAYVAALRRSAGFDSAAMARFEQAYAAAKRYYEVTRELGAHLFEIKVTMPGDVVAHNGDRLEEEDGGQTVTFEFDGRALRDRTHELIVVSRVVETPGS